MVKPYEATVPHRNFDGGSTIEKPDTTVLTAGAIKRRGRKGARALSKDERRMIRALRAEGHSSEVIARRLGRSPGCVYRFLRGETYGGRVNTKGWSRKAPAATKLARKVQTVPVPTPSQLFGVELKHIHEQPLEAQVVFWRKQAQKAIAKLMEHGIISVAM